MFLERERYWKGSVIEKGVLLERECYWKGSVIGKGALLEIGCYYLQIQLLIGIIGFIKKLNFNLI